MTELLNFAGEHWFLAWCALWLAWAPAWFAMAALRLPLVLVQRILRTIKVALRGWPPAHLDADGDWKPEPKETAQ